TLLTQGGASGCRALGYRIEKGTIYRNRSDTDITSTREVGNADEPVTAPHGCPRPGTHHARMLWRRDRVSPDLRPACARGVPLSREPTRRPRGRRRGHAGDLRARAHAAPLHARG